MPRAFTPTYPRHTQLEVRRRSKTKNGVDEGKISRHFRLVERRRIKRRRREIFPPCSELGCQENKWPGDAPSSTTQRTRTPMQQQHSLVPADVPVNSFFILPVFRTDRLILNHFIVSFFTRRLDKPYNTQMV